MNKEDEVQRQWKEWQKQIQDEPLRIADINNCVEILEIRRKW